MKVGVGGKRTLLENSIKQSLLWMTLPTFGSSLQHFRDIQFFLITSKSGYWNFKGECVYVYPCGLSSFLDLWVNGPRKIQINLDQFF